MVVVVVVVCVCVCVLNSNIREYCRYVGGLDSCRHGWHLLDADQEVPWLDQPLIYYKKFRVYFQVRSSAALRHSHHLILLWLL